MGAGLLLLVFLVSTPSSVMGADGPIISNLKVKPRAGFAGSSYIVRVQVEDPQGPNDIVAILFHQRESMEWMKVPINDKGLNGDIQAGDGIYTGRTTVPRSADKKAHRFSVYVEDKAGHTSNTLTYTFTVLQKFSL